MILFEQDIRASKVLIDYQTKNASFIHMSMVLQRMGVANNKFFLALHQQELQGIDPHNLKDTSLELKQRIAYESKINPWYYVREIVRVPVTGPIPTPYQLNRANLALTWLFLSNIDTFLTMPRQIGKTVAVLVPDSWLMYIAGVNYHMAYLANSTNLIHQTVDKMREIRNELPPYLVHKHVRNTDNKEGLSYHPLGTRYITKVAQSDRRAAIKLGMGQSNPKQHWDEVCNFPNIDISLPSAISATSAAKDQAKLAEIPVSNMYTSTAGDLQDPSGQYAYSMKSGALRFNEKMYDAPNVEALHAVLNRNSQNKMFYLEYSYLQLGKSKEWFREKTANITCQKTIEKDYLNRWQKGSKDAIVPKRMIDLLENGKAEPLKTTIFETLIINWYVDPETLTMKGFKERRFIMGGDTSENIGIDFTTLVMVDPHDMTLIFTMRCNTSNLIYVAKLIVKYLKKFENSIAVLERNYAATLIDLIIVELCNAGLNPFLKLFNTAIQDFKPGNPHPSTLTPDGPIRKCFGFRTTSAANSRKLLYKEVLMTAIEKNHDRMFDATLIDEITSLTIRNGRVDHPEGSHDDLLIAYLLTIFFILFGKNLHMYGIKEGEFLAGMADNGSKVDPTVKERQRQIQQEIDRIERLVEKTSSELLKISYARELKHLKSLVNEDIISDSSNHVISVQQVKEAVKPPKRSLTDLHKLINFL